MRRLVLSTRDRRAVTAGGILLLALVIASKGLPMVRGWEMERVAAASVATLRANALNRAYSTRSTGANELAARRRRKAAIDSALFVVQTAGSAAATILGVARALIGGEGIFLHALQPRVDSTQTHGLVLASARASITADLEGLVELLQNIEAHRPLLRISELSIVQTEVSSSDDRPDVLKVELTVQGIGMIRRPIQ